MKLGQLVPELPQHLLVVLLRGLHACLKLIGFLHFG